MKLMQISVLEKIEQKLHSMKEITGVFYSGSIASGKLDKFSDLDIFLIADKARAKKVFAKLEKWISSNWEIKMRHICDISMIIFIGETFLKVEFELLSKEKIMPEYKLKFIKIAKDTNNFLKNLKKTSMECSLNVSKKEAEELFFESRDSQLYAARHAARGWKWSAMGEANYHGEQLFYFLAKLKDRHQFGFREAEKFLAKHELAMLKETRCRSTDAKEIQRAMKANWNFMKYVERYYEKISGNKLHTTSSDYELLRVVEGIYGKI